MSASAYERLCELAATHGWRVAIHAPDPDDDAGDYQTLAVWDRSPRHEDAALVDVGAVMVIPDAASLDWTATQILANLRVRP